MDHKPLQDILASCTYSVSNEHILTDRSIVMGSDCPYTAHTTVLVCSDGYVYHTEYIVKLASASISMYQ